MPLEDALVEDPIQVMFNGGVDGMRVLHEVLYREARALSPLFAVSLTEYVHRDFSLIDVTAPTATKGRALRVARGTARADSRRGDGDWATTSTTSRCSSTRARPVVMANAVDGLKDRGWHVTGHQDEAGLAQAIRRFALG